MDVLSDIVAALRVRSTGLATLNLTSPWRLGTPDRPATGLFMMIDGRCVLDTPGRPPTWIEPGDLVLLTSIGGVFRSGQANGGSIDEILQQDAPAFWSPGRPVDPPRLVEHGGGGPKTTLMALGISQHGDGVALPAVLPVAIHIARETLPRFPWLVGAMDLLRLEAAPNLEGGRAAGARLAELLFVYMLRAHLFLHPSEASTGVSGLGDARIARALGAIHSSPAKSWTVTRLAQEAAMSRSAFAERFGAVVGQPPLQYLTQRRMDLAAARLVRGEACLEGLARDLGYRSQHAFSHAFKRNRGIAPSEYRRRAQRGSALE